MAEWRLRTEIFNFAETKVVEAIQKSKEAMKPSDIEGWSGMGGRLPFISLLFPYLQTFYQAGYAVQETQAANKLFETFRLNPELVFRLWWKLYKGEGRPENILNDLREQGWSADRIELAKKATEVMPTPQDIVAFLAHEVYEPTMIDKYGLDDEWDKVDKSKFSTIGMTEEVALDYWRNH